MIHKRLKSMEWSSLAEEILVTAEPLIPLDKIPLAIRFAEQELVISLREDGRHNLKAIVLPCDVRAALDAMNLRPWGTASQV